MDIINIFLVVKFDFICILQKGRLVRDCECMDYKSSHYKVHESFK